MRLFAKLFEKGEDPCPSFDDPQLGVMRWSQDDEAWIGNYSGFEFALAYERKATPTPQVLVYAKDVLSDPAWLAGTLEAEKKRWALKAPASLKGEIEALAFGLVYFSMRQDGGYIIATVEGGHDPRCWRIEYHGRNCDGMGFDT